MTTACFLAPPAVTRYFHQILNLNRDLAGRCFLFFGRGQKDFHLLELEFSVEKGAVTRVRTVQQLSYGRRPIRFFISKGALKTFLDPPREIFKLSDSGTRTFYNPGRNGQGDIAIEVLDSGAMKMWLLGGDIGLSRGHEIWRHDRLQSASSFQLETAGPDKMAEPPKIILVPRGKKSLVRGYLNYFLVAETWKESIRARLNLP